MLAQRGKTDWESEISRGGSLVGTAKLAVGVECSRYPRPSSRGRLPVPSGTHGSNVAVTTVCPRVELDITLLYLILNKKQGEVHNSTLLLCVIDGTGKRPRDEGRGYLERSTPTASLAVPTSDPPRDISDKLVFPRWASTPFLPY